MSAAMKKLESLDIKTDDLSYIERPYDDAFAFIDVYRDDYPLPVFGYLYDGTENEMYYADSKLPDIVWVERVLRNKEKPIDLG